MYDKVQRIKSGFLPNYKLTLPMRLNNILTVITFCMKQFWLSWNYYSRTH